MEATPPGSGQKRQHDQAYQVCWVESRVYRVESTLILVLEFCSISFEALGHNYTLDMPPLQSKQYLQRPGATSVNKGIASIPSSVILYPEVGCVVNHNPHLHVIYSLILQTSYGKEMVLCLYPCALMSASNTLKNTCYV